jgi:polysaccharide biosynthesis protein PslG
MRLLRPMLVLALACALLAGAADTASARISRNFFGIQDWSTNLPNASDFSTLRRARVGVYRVNLEWARVEPTPGERDWRVYDALVENAARNGIKVLPVVFTSPHWAAARGQYPPAPGPKRDAYMRFLHDAVARYGRGGTFWSSHASLQPTPITDWQIWNEPNFKVYWAGHVNAKSYVKFLRGAYRTVKGVNGSARVVLAGLPDTSPQFGVKASRFLKAVYKVRRAKRYFDVVAIHPYAKDWRGVLGGVIRARRLMSRYHDSRTPLYITEVGWAGGFSDPTKPNFSGSERSQAKRLKALYTVLEKKRHRYRLRLVSWFAFKDRARASGERNWWAIHTGLLRRDGTGKKAWKAFKKATNR